MSYISGFKNPFLWYKNYLNSLSTNGSLTITPTDFRSTVSDNFNLLETSVTSNNVWNRNSSSLVDNFQSFYKSADQVFNYLTELTTKLEGPIKQLEANFRKTKSQYRTQLFNKSITNSKFIALSPKDYSNIEETADIYNTYPQMVTEDDSFVLKDNGFASVIRSLSGFDGQLVIENTISNIFTEGEMSNCVDGSKSTYFLMKSFVPNIITTNQQDVSWIPSNYKHGALTQLSFKLSSQALVNEIFIDPVTTEPFNILGVSWAPSNPIDITPTFPGATTLIAGTTVNLTEGLTGNNCLQVVGSSYGSHTITLPTAPLVTAGTSVATTKRVDFSFYTKAVGSSYSGIRILWLNASSATIGVELFDDFTTSFYELRKYSAYAPPLATQMIVQFGVFKQPTITTTTYFSNPTITIGEEYQSFDTLINGETTLKLAKNVLTDRLSLLVNQRTIKRAVRQVNIEETPDISNLEILPSVQKLYTPGLPVNETAEFCYTFGFREVDFRYREHVPRGSLLSKKLETSREVRKLWSTIDGINMSGVTLSVLLNDTQNTKFNIKPFNLDGSTVGDQIEIRTQEEIDYGIVNTEAQTLIVNPIKVIEEHAGTDRNNKIRLKKPVHNKKYLIKEIQNWLDTYSINPAVYDPNTSQIIGTTSVVTKNEYRNDPTSVTSIDPADLVIKQNYVPVSLKIKSDLWTAYPDTLGSAQASAIRTITREKLNQVSTISDTYQASNPVVSFNTWLGQTSVNKAIELASQYQFTNIKQELSYLTVDKNSSLSALPELNTSSFIKLYEKLKVDNRLTYSGAKQSSTTISKASVKTYSTDYYPIVPGNQGSFLRVWFRNPTNGEFKELTSSEFTVLDYNLGVIEILTSFPTGFSEVHASYSFFTSKSKEDFNSYVSSNLITDTDPDIKEFSNPAQSYPVTRNITDYLNGSIPKLKKPNFNELSPDYYPVIEYYQTSDNEIIFAESYYEYGDNPAKIEVNYESLNIQPSLLVTTTRDGSYVSSPQINSVTLNTKEAQVVSI